MDAVEIIYKVMKVLKRLIQAGSRNTDW